MNNSIIEAVNFIIKLEEKELRESQSDSFDIEGATQKAINKFKNNFDKKGWIKQGTMSKEEYEQARGQFITSAIAEFNK